MRLMLPSLCRVFRNLTRTPSGHPPLVIPLVRRCNTLVRHRLPLRQTPCCASSWQAAARSSPRPRISLSSRRAAAA
eukprot:scaffold102698_cov57-Phaeocystis_antarctica.AAC.2